MDITLYYHPRTRAFRVRWLLEELELQYKLRFIDLFAGDGNTEAYKRIQPHGWLPAIEINGRVMFESSAICHWLADQFIDKGLAPGFSDPARMPYTQWMYYVPATLEPPIYYEFLHTQALPEAQRVPGIERFCSGRYQESFEILNSAYEDKTYLINNRFSTVDLMISSILVWRVKTAIRFPNLRRVIENVTARSAYQRAKADVPESRSVLA